MALLLVPFMVLLGVAIDTGQLLIVKNQLQSAIDAAALDIGTNPNSQAVRPKRKFKAM